MLTDWGHHPFCGCERVVTAGAAAAAGADGEDLPKLNWVGASTEPARLPLSETAGQACDAMLIGGDNYHFLLDSSRGVGAQLEAAGLTVHYTEDTDALSAESLAHTKVLVILKDGGWPPEPGSQWMKPDQEKAIEEWVLAGGGLMPLHNSLWAIPGWKEELSAALINSNGLTAYTDVSFDEGVDESLSTDPEKMHPFRRTAGGVGGYHPSFERQWVKVIDDAHAVTRHIGDYEIGDEQHFVFYDRDRGVKPLLVNVGSEAGGHQGPSFESCAGFAHEYGKGRSVYLGSAHTLEGMRHPTVQKLYGNAIRWLLRESEGGKL